MNNFSYMEIVMVWLAVFSASYFLRDVMKRYQQQKRMRKIMCYVHDKRYAIRNSKERMVDFILNETPDMRDPITRRTYQALLHEQPHHYLEQLVEVLLMEHYTNSSYHYDWMKEVITTCSKTSS